MLHDVWLQTLFGGFLSLIVTGGDLFISFGCFDATQECGVFLLECERFMGRFHQHELVVNIVHFARSFLRQCAFCDWRCGSKKKTLMDLCRPE